jgi:hypothetical protein
VKQHIVMFSGGLCSWAAAKLVAQRHGTDRLTLLFCDTLIEDEDTYRFLREAAANVGGKFVRIADGRDPWQVFHKERIIGNSRIDPCSKILKRQLADRWLRDNCDQAATICYVGIHWSESERFVAIKRRYAPWAVEAPLCDRPLIGMDEIRAWAEREGLEEQRLYKMGFSHANCGGFCVKAGHGHFANLLAKMPERYAYHEAKEQEMRDFLGKDVSILTRTKNGVKTPLTLRQFREERERGEECNLFDLGGCNCFSEDAADAGRE